jgi:thiamine-monophosphate kinase
MVCPEKPGEFDLIQRLTGEVRVFSDQLRTGIGDDCAVIATNGENDLLLTSDIFVENVHFDRKWFLPEQIGGKAFRAGLSDIAAMGGDPEYALVSLAVPVSQSQQEIESIYRGIRKAAEAFQVSMVGGDLSRSEEGIIIDIILIGKVIRDQAVLRSGSKPGDHIFVSGNLGEASLGLRILESGRTGPGSEHFINRQRVPEPRISLGQVLCQGRWASAMIDISDGLSSDLGHLCKASGVGARMILENLPVSDAYRRICERHDLEVLSGILDGGEDYELLFTVPPDRVEEFNQVKLPVSVTEIGEILQDSREMVLELTNGQTRALCPGGYDHFRETN